MTNDKTRSQLPLGTNPFSTGWSPSIWGKPSPPALSNSGSRGSPQEATPAVPNPLPQTNSTRNTSGSTSPIITRDTASYMPPAPAHRPSAIGQRPVTNGTVQWSPPSMFGTTHKQNSRSAEYLENSREEQSGVMFGANAGYGPESSSHDSRTEPRVFHNLQRGAAAPTFTRDNSRGLGSHPDTESRAQGTSSSGNGYDSPAGLAVHSQQQIFGRTPADMRGWIDPSDDLADMGRRVEGVSLDDGSVAPSGGAGSFPTYNSTGRPPFEFNPVTKEWENNRTQAIGDDGHLQSTQEGTSDRGFPTGGPYPPSRSGSRIAIGASQPVQNQLFGPNVRRIPETNPRGRGQVTPQHLHQPYGPPQQYYDTRYPPVPQPFNIQYNQTGTIGLPPNMQYPPTYQIPMGYNTGHQTRTGRGCDSTDETRSPLLREFRMSHKTHRRYELRDIYGHIVEFCGDQHGSRFIQEKLERANSDEKDRVFSEIIKDAIPLMKDVFGNYVVQKLFEHGTQPQKQLLADRMQETLISLSVDQYGCRVVQKALNYVLVKQRSALISELEPDVLKVMKDQHGNHVIQKALEAGLPEDLGFIFRSFRGRVKELACHTCACRVLQKAMDRSPTAKASIIEEILPQARELTNDQYGNYVIQHVLKIGRPEDRTRIINSILGSVVHFSKQKYASNVIEKCALYGTPEEVLKIEAEMTATGPDGNTFLHSMIVDQYANYVVQKHLDITPNTQAFRAALRPALQWARDSGYTGKHVDTIARLLEETSRPQRSLATPSTRYSRHSSRHSRHSSRHSQHSSTAPTSPLQLDVGSAAPTPNLTMEPNSPSSSPPSTTESAVDEPVRATLKGSMASTNGRRLSPEVRVAEDS